MSEMVSFDPSLFSISENQFLYEHVGEPVIVALKSVQAPVNPRAVRPILERVFELEQLKAHEGADWVGVDALKKQIKIYLEQNAKWKTDAKRSLKAPRYPSMFSFDQKGRAHRGGVGSDSGRIRSYFGPDGKRHKFEIDLLPDYLPEWQAPGVTEIPEKGLVVNDELNRIECFCGHTESFKGESRASYSAARARISKHLRRADKDVDQHRELWSNEFGS